MSDQGVSTVRVAVIPPTPALNNNALFQSRREDRNPHSPNTHWLDCFAAVFDKAGEFNIRFDTADVFPKNDADILIYMAQPNSPKDVAAQKLECPRQKLVLIIWETALGARYTFNPRNHRAYDAVFTYATPLVDEKRYFYLPPRAYYRSRIATGLPFAQRRLGCLVGTNRQLRYRSGLFTMIKGWRFSLKDWVDYVFCPGELISFRSKVGKACAVDEDGFDVFGEGWDLYSETQRVCLGVPSESTLTYAGKYRYYFALENHGSDCSLISERIWDALWADTVPVYLGYTGLDKVVPRDCYIDAREFRDPTEMLTRLRRTPESVWERHHRAGREFINSSAVERFLPEAFAEHFVRRIAAIAGRGSSPL